MTDREIDQLLERAGQIPHEVEPLLLKRVADSIRPTLAPVRPLPPSWVLTVGVVLVCMCVALAGATRAGFYGVEKMHLMQRALIFAILAVLAWLAGNLCVAEMIPGGQRRVSPGALLGMGSMALVGVFALSFRDYHTDHFLSAGIACLLTGLLHAVLAAVLSWLVLRRGFAVSPVSAGMVAGTLAGLAGVGMLELHCGNFQATHVLVWHTAVLPLSAAAGAVAGWMGRSRSSGAKHDN